MIQPPSVNVCQLTASAQRLRPRRLRALRAAFQLTPEEDLEDAIQQAELVMIAQPDRFTKNWQDSEDALFRLLHTVAWRALRGELRRSCRRQPHSPASLPTLPDHQALPEASLMLREALALLPQIVRIAARRHGGSYSKLLEEALWRRLFQDSSDSRVARELGIPREYLNRARRQVEREMASLGEPSRKHVS